MSAALAILWFVWFIVSVVMVQESHSVIGLTRMFPEGHRRWHAWVQSATLASFAAAIHFNPFTS